ncbi:MAG: hypothetical protein M3552_15325 [Planctomycetota bacterium]|nr:hypothetical protein [Planctomycetaceae bacterium]MDQ3332002.1 hypothetical protein [Planctomycetota bacterium]
MAFDVYHPCPFCTDKKLKFCCADIAEEMEKVARLNESGQHRAAMKILDRLAVSRPNTVWNEASRATLLLGEGQVDEAKAVLEKLHGVEPENLAVIALLATASFAADGYAAAREAIWRAFRKATAHSDLVSALAMGIAGEMFDHRKYLSARQHLTLAMRLAPSRNKQAIFVRLLEFDGNAEIPYPLRSVHSLREISGDADRQDSSRKAMRLAERGCFGLAAERFVHLAQDTPDDPAVEYNFALCKAWEGDEEVAAEAFGRAALAEPDFELAAEYAALEQFLRSGFDDRIVRMQNVEYRVPSASKMLADLDADARCVRFSLPPEATAGEDGVPDGIFELLDRPMPESIEGLSAEELPRAVGQVAIFSTSEDSEGPRAALAAFEGRDVETAKSLIAAVASDVELVEEGSEEGDVALPRDLAELHVRLAYPDKTSAKTRRGFERSRWEKAVETWLETPQEALIGKTPTQAASDEGLRVPLAGAIYVLDAFCLRYRYTLDAAGLRSRLGLPAIPQVEVSPDLPLNTFSAIQLHRLPVERLDDRQLSVVLNRSLLVHHGVFLKAVLEEALKRSLPDVDTTRLYMTLSDLARDQGDASEALRWTNEGRQAAKSGENSFENVFRWDTKELGLRLEDPESEDLQPFVRRIASYYGPKVPRFTEYLNHLLLSVGVTPPSVLEPVGAASSGVWTPDQGSGTAEKKLWLPGS